MKKLLYVAMILFTLLFAAGCGGEIDPDDSSALPGDNGNGRPTGNKDLTGLALPEDYPRELVPIIDGGKITAVENTLGGWTITVQSERDLDEAAGFYDSVLPRAGDLDRAYYNTGADLLDGWYYDLSARADAEAEGIITILIFVAPR